MKKFEYQPTYKYKNYVQEFVYSISYQLMNYLNDLSKQIPKNCYELHYITYDLLLIKDALLTLKSPYFHDSNEPISYDKYISYELMCLLHMKANDLAHMIDRVILKITEQYFINSSNEILNKRLQSKLHSSK